jgi:glutaredoxin 3
MPASCATVAPIPAMGVAQHCGRPHIRRLETMMTKVEIYTKFLCPYCARAMKLLGSKGIAPEEFDISMGGPKRAEMLERSGGRQTVPQIFINGNHVGGSDELAALERDGKLDGLLAA